jgi:hypothetical protein
MSLHKLHGGRVFKEGQSVEEMKNAAITWLLRHGDATPMIELIEAQLEPRQRAALIRRFNTCGAAIHIERMKAKYAITLPSGSKVVL